MNYTQKSVNEKKSGYIRPTIQHSLMCVCVWSDCLFVCVCLCLHTASQTIRSNPWGGGGGRRCGGQRQKNSLSEKDTTTQWRHRGHKAFLITVHDITGDQTHRSFPWIRGQ